MEKILRSRRNFLWQLAALLLGGGLLVRYLLPARELRNGVLRVPLADVPTRGALVYRQSRIVLVQEAGEVIALSLVCTHLGCTLQVTPGGLECPCHGSCFDRNGQVLEGPASRSLERYAVNLTGEHIEVQLGPGRVA